MFRAELIVALYSRVFCLFVIKYQISVNTNKLILSHFIWKLKFLNSSNETLQLFCTMVSCLLACLLPCLLNQTIIYAITARFILKFSIKEKKWGKKKCKRNEFLVWTYNRIVKKMHLDFCGRIIHKQKLFALWVFWKYSETRSYHAKYV